MIEFRLPELGEGIYEAELVQWHVGPGESITHGATLAEVMTDKATMDLPSPFEGQVTDLHCQTGEMIEVGQAILSYQPSRHVAQTDSDRRTEPAADPPSAETQRPATASLDGDTTPSSATSTAVQPVEPLREEDGADPVPDRVRAAPAVRQLAQSLNIPLASIAGSGPDGRILIDDLGTYLIRPPSSPTSGRPARSPFDLGTAGKRIKMQGLRRTIARNMTASKQAVPHFSYIDECQVTRLVELKNQLKRPLYRQKVKLTLLPFFVKAVARALQVVPLVNASLDEANDEIVCHDRYDIGIAMATPIGLTVPVIRNADQRGIADIARELERLGRSIRAGDVQRDELRGSTFTVSSVGNFGGLVSTPVINYPEVGIVALGKVFKRPVFDEHDQIVPARVVYLSFSFDHRVIDGNIGAIFSNAVIDQLENPEALL